MLEDIIKFLVILLLFKGMAWMTTQNDIAEAELELLNTKIELNQY